MWVVWGCNLTEDRLGSKFKRSSVDPTCAKAQACRKCKNQKRVCILVSGPRRAHRGRWPCWPAAHFTAASTNDEARAAASFHPRHYILPGWWEVKGILSLVFSILQLPRAVVSSSSRLPSSWMYMTPKLEPKTTFNSLRTVVARDIFIRLNFNIYHHLMNISWVMNKFKKQMSNFIIVIVSVRFFFSLHMYPNYKLNHLFQRREVSLIFTLETKLVFSIKVIHCAINLSYVYVLRKLLAFPDWQSYGFLRRELPSSGHMTNPKIYLTEVYIFSCGQVKIYNIRYFSMRHFMPLISYFVGLILNAAKNQARCIVLSHF